LGVASGERPVARWVDPVCPAVHGIAEPYARIVENRMRAIAAQAGIAAARSGCRPNISVSFVGDAAALARDVARRTPTRLSEVPSGARQALLEGRAPVRWWYRTDTRSRHNVGDSTAPSPFVTSDEAEGGGSPIPASIPSILHYDSSIASTQVNRVLVNATIVIDLNEATGQPLEAVAAYAAFVAFAEIRSADAAPPVSILGMFAPAAGVTRMTDWDMAFLRALYRLPLDRQARRHRGLLVREMVGFQTGG
jgi:hypothetical protein